MSMVIVGALCDFGALSFAPQSVIMPVGSFTLVANVMFAHFWLGEALGNMDIMGTVLIVVGATLIAVAYGASHSSSLILRWKDLYSSIDRLFKILKSLS